MTSDTESSAMVSLVANSLGLAGVAVCSISALRSIFRQMMRNAKSASYERIPEIYEDRDGPAASRAVPYLSDGILRQIGAILVLIGTMVTLSRAVLTTDKANSPFMIEQWLQFSAWILLSMQWGAILTEPLSTIRFRMACHTSIGSALWMAMAFAEMLAQFKSSVFDKVQLILATIQFFLATFSAALALFLPRRPDVLRNGTIIDRQFTTTALGRLTFSWVEPLMNLAVRNESVDMKDLAELDYDTRSKTLHASFNEQKTQDYRNRTPQRLWKRVILCHKSAIILQFIMAITVSFLSFLPQIALLGTLRALEARSQSTEQSTHVFICVLGFGVSMISSSTLDVWLLWISTSRLGMKISAQLTVVIFDKSIHLQNVKDSVQSIENSQEETSEHCHNSDTSKNTRQSTLNLMSVDVKRIADFASFNYFLYQCPLKLGVACTLLASLVGWEGLLAGLSVLVITIPLNAYAARKYSGSQAQIMKTRDLKMAVIVEALRGIRQIKFTSLESSWEEKINAFRDTELRAQWRAFIWQTALFALSLFSPLMLSAAALGVFALVNGGLPASVAFTAVSVFGSIENTLAVFPESIAWLVDCAISLRRLEFFLKLPENTCQLIPADRISFVNATISWPSGADEGSIRGRFVLEDITMELPKSGLSVISGPTGSGKSLLLSAILGESDVLSGSIKAPLRPTFQEHFDGNNGQWIIESAMAYVSQVPWIENGSIKDNILFGLPCDSERYQDVLFACALDKDLTILSDGDLTEIGAQGVNISGGQKWRISLARALYSRAGILVMDDVFSAVDIHTARHILDHAITGQLTRGRTRVLVTHHTTLCLSAIDYAVHLDNGRVCYTKTGNELRRDGGLQIPTNQALDAEFDDSILMDATQSPGVTNASRPSCGIEDTQDGGKQPSRKLVKDEGRANGAVKWKVYKGYLAQGGNIWLCAILPIVYLGYSGLMIARAWWLNVWTSHQSAPEQDISVIHQAVNYMAVQKIQLDDDIGFSIAVYVGISLLACVAGSLRVYFMFSLSLRASRNLFRHLLHAILRAPLRWLDTVPLGRILNRFSADFSAIDTQMGLTLGNTIYCAIEVIGAVFAGAMVNPVLAVLTGIIVIVSLSFSRKYLAAAREVNRLGSTAKSPIFVQFDSMLSGLDTIRAFGKSENYISRVQAAVDRHAQAYWHGLLLNRWLAFRMELMGFLFTFTTMVLVTFAKGITASVAGFAISFALRYTGVTSRAIRVYVTLEMALNSTERVQEYSDIDIEEPYGIDPPATWPTEGRLDVSNLVVGYAPDLPPVLKGLNFQAEPNQRIGVVGRTGAGKSSLALALFRFLEARQGQILVDGIDIAKVKLHHLRSRLAIIPQDPVLFSGTVRSNLDPFDQHDDMELHSALEQVNWGGGSATSKSVTDESTILGTASNSSIASATTRYSSDGLFSKVGSLLDQPISQGGQNLSQGQRQLLCLARAIISRPKIMVLDEATSAVDGDTDEFIQQSIRSEFGRNSTLLVIAHRISTIADFDRILVLDAGKAVEFGPPRDLMKIDGGVFRSLVEENGDREVLENIIFG
ncbi:hypothetical protein N7478_007588 [Penicillium angulare]|uniref:uncharacterized protein n=1 Tax=Penicillium angulare TaxID=116970 RepID=UPI002541A709|nr:uncharacterized protein N7478_007588 [Penicillium angulare]KAJ5272463.1 hypothetical protein N7478_007588 [Penicillium angulare]